MSKPIPKAIASAVMLTVAAAALLTFTRGDGPRPDALSSASVPNVSGTNAPSVTGHAQSHHQAKPKPKATAARSTQDPATATATPSTTTTTGSPVSSPTPHGTKAPDAVSSPTPDPSPSPTSGTGLLGLLEDVLNPHH